MLAKASVLAAALLAPAVRAEILGCTALAIDGAATVDGSSFAGMNADCQDCDGRVAYVEAAEHAEGSMRPVHIFKPSYPRYVGWDRGSFYHPEPGQEVSHPIGEIPQVRKTYAYWEGTLPLMNEKGLAFGESSCASRLLNYPVGQAPEGLEPATGLPRTEGLLDLTSLMQVAAERCATARCAVEVMGEMSDKFGFFPMVGEWNDGLLPGNITAYDDGGEAVTVADTTGEAWVFHVCGGVDGVTKSIWAAQRVPKGHAAFIANNYIIRALPFEPTDDFVFSAGIFKGARKMGLWKDSDGPLDFSRVFAPDSLHFQSPPGNTPVPLYATLRNWGIFKLVAPKKYENVKLPLDCLDLPPSEQVESLLDHQDVFKFLSHHYQGTEFDLTKGVLAGPFGNPYTIEGGKSMLFGQIPRGISISRTIYSTIGMPRVGGQEPVLWFAPDTPLSSVYVPFYPRAGGRHASPYSTGFQRKFSRDSAYWAMDFVTNFASAMNWQNSSGQFVLPNRQRLHDEIQMNMSKIEELASRNGTIDLDMLAEWQEHTQQTVVDQWWELADTLIGTYNDGYYNDLPNNKIGMALGYPVDFAKKVGFNHDVHPVYIKRDYSQDKMQTSQLPVEYDMASNTWLYPAWDAVDAAPAGISQLDEAEFEPESSTLSMASVMGTLGVGLVVSAGAFVAGSSYERRRNKNSQHETPFLRLA